jgi:hypothetical protein
MRGRARWLGEVLVVVLVVVLWPAGCGIRCGAGTVEVNGTCVVSEQRARPVDLGCGVVGYYDTSECEAGTIVVGEQCVSIGSLDMGCDADMGAMDAGADLGDGPSDPPDISCSGLEGLTCRQAPGCSWDPGCCVSGAPPICVAVGTPLQGAGCPDFPCTTGDAGAGDGGDLAAGKDAAADLGDGPDVMTGAAAAGG